jgi:hypothetical protein
MSLQNFNPWSYQHESFDLFGGGKTRSQSKANANRALMPPPAARKPKTKEGSPKKKTSPRKSKNSPATGSAGKAGAAKKPRSPKRPKDVIKAAKDKKLQELAIRKFNVQITRLTRKYKLLKKKHDEQVKKIAKNKLEFDGRGFEKEFNDIDDYVVNQQDYKNYIRNNAESKSALVKDFKDKLKVTAIPQNISTKSQASIKKFINELVTFLDLYKEYEENKIFYEMAKGFTTRKEPKVTKKQKETTAFQGKLKHVTADKKAKLHKGTQKAALRKAARKMYKLQKNLQDFNWINTRIIPIPVKRVKKD